MVRRVAVLGSTGSVGRQTLEVIEALFDEFAVYALAAGRNVAELNQQVQRFHPVLVSLSENSTSRGCVIDGPHVLRGEEALIELAVHPEVDIVVIATPGAIGLAPTLAALRVGKKVALANKEVLVMAGELVMGEAERQGIEIRPIDSEHSALWQCLQGENKSDIMTLWLTASGGPFRDYSTEELQRVTPAEALRHPNWAMGPKVTIDSATLMNKGFEVIEAHWLFAQPYDRIKVILHHQSIIHSMVELADGSIKAQLGAPDMRLPIQYALIGPRRPPNEFHKLDWRKIRTLTFDEPDPERFPCLCLAYEAGRMGGTYPTVLSAADEVAVELFLQERIRLTDIPHVIAETMAHHQSVAHPTEEDILVAAEWARGQALAYATTLAQSP